jgi:release factor glutamine methyltransferase
VEKALERLKNHEPIQYVLGKTEFFGLPFGVNSSVLVPRPETEELVQWLLEESYMPGMRILDVGTGSGCIAISIKKEWPEANVWGWDISTTALETANQNARLNQVDVHFEQQDILTLEWKAPVRFHIIVSNPPYVRLLEKGQMDKNVLAYEPSTALFVPDNDALLFYRVIARFARKALEPGGLLFFEINQAFGAEVVGLLEGEGFREVVLRPDLSGRDRMIRARWS